MFKVADLPNGVRLRMSQRGDRSFDRQLHDANRQDLALINGDRDFVQSLVDMQYRARDSSYEAAYPNAYHYIIEKSGQAVGRLLLDFGPAEVRVIDLSIHPGYQGLGVGTTVLTALQNVAAQVSSPIALAVRRDNGVALHVYTSLGFVLDADNDPFAMHLLLRWEPTRDLMETRIFMPEGRSPPSDKKVHTESPKGTTNDQ